MRLLRHHLYFACALAAGAALRLLATIAYFPALWFNDSFDYVRIAVAPFPHPVRPDGYGLLLWTLRPFHSLALVVALQHAMGLATVTMIYALLRRRFALPGWAACLAVVPVLFDAYEIQLEHLLMSDTLFAFLVVSAVTVVLWRPTVTWRVGAVTGLLLALAALTRTVGLPLVVVLVAYLAMRRVSWRSVGAVVLAAALPLAAYALWFQSANDRFALTGVDGVFLWGRTAAFADCATIKPPPDLAPLCPRMPVDRRPASSSQVWGADSPMGWRAGQPFSPELDRQARRFALRAIAAQPGAYAETVGRGVVLTFDWNRHAYPTTWTSGLYRFPSRPLQVPDVPVVGSGTAASVVHTYDGGYHGVRMTGPAAALLRGYQQQVYLRGPILAVIMVIGLAGLIRRRSGTALPWLAAASLLLIPLLTTDFDYRYVLPAAPFACLAAAVALRPADGPLAVTERCYGRSPTRSGGGPTGRSRRSTGTPPSPRSPRGCVTYGIPTAERRSSTTAEVARGTTSAARTTRRR